MKFAVYCAAAAGKDNLYIKLATGQSINFMFIASGTGSIDQIRI